MPTQVTDPLLARIRRAQAGIAATDRELSAACETPKLREISRLEHELANRRAYLAELVVQLRRPAR
jgi:hypothetical protein